MLKLESIADIEVLHHNQVQESANLEYKASPAVDNAEPRKSEIAKDVSAIANADGGQIIYGMTEKDHYPAGLDSGIDPTKYNGLWFEQVIQQNIRPQIEGLKILCLPLPSGQIVVVVTIPAAMTRAPHQAKDGKYYRRRNFRNDFMEDYEVREAMRRTTTPNLFLKIELSLDNVTWNDDRKQTEPISLQMNVGNLASEPALYTHFRVLFDAEMVIKEKGTSHIGTATFPDGTPANVLEFPLVAPHHMPLFNNIQFRLGSGTKIALPDPYRYGDARFQIGYTIRAPGYSLDRFGELIKRGDSIKLYLKDD